MEPELFYLAASVVLFLVMVMTQAVAAVFSGKASMGDLFGPRDALPATGLTPIHGRTRRAQMNMIEAMCMFVPAVLIAVVAGETSSLTALGAALFFWARLAYAPLYWFGVPVLRTVAWALSLAGIILILWELFV